MQLEQNLVPPNPSLFFTKNDAADPRMGEMTSRDLAQFPGGARVALIGVPQDIGVARNGGRRGAAAAPDAIRALLYRLTPYDIETSRSLPEGFLFDLGNIRCDGELEEIHDRVSEVVAEVCSAGLVPLVLGGGHDTTYAAASGVHAALGTLGLINFDAHLDVRPLVAHGAPHPLRNSGTSFRMLLEEEKIAPGSFAEFGIQSFVNSAEHARWVTETGARILTLEEIQARGFSKMLSTAYQICSSGRHPIYATMDMDGVRAADAPGVSAPLPDGFTAEHYLAAARLLGRKHDTVALDICELNPEFDIDHRTARLAAHMVLRFLMGKMEGWGGATNG